MLTNIFPDADVLVVFLLACLALQTLPGPGSFLVIANGIAQGYRGALACVLGIFATVVLQAPLVAFGVGELVVAFPGLFLLIKALGCGYLLYIAWLALRTTNVQIADTPANNSYARAFLQGFVTNLTNPKVVLFLMAFVPQFMDRAKGAEALQILLLCLIMKANGFCVNAAIGLMAAKARSFFARAPCFLLWQKRLAGLILIGIVASLLAQEIG